MRGTGKGRGERRVMRWAACAAGVLALLMACGGSASAPLRVTLVPPADAMPAPGARVVFQVLAEGGENPAFQWLRNGLPIPGASSAVLVLGPVAAGDAGSYQVRVSAGGTTLVTAPFDLEPVDNPWLVTSAADAGPGSLRAILAQANGYPGLNGIEFALPGPGPYRITLASTLPAVTGKVCILGPYGSSLTLDGGGACRPLFLDGGALVLDNFTVANGLGKGGDGLGGGGGGAGLGGALFMNSGSLGLRRMVFQGNRAVGGSSFPGADGENGGGGGFGGDSPAAGGAGAGGGLLGGAGGLADLVHGEANDGTGGSGGAGGGAARGGANKGGDGSDFGGGGFSVGPQDAGGGGMGGFGGGGGGSGGLYLGAMTAGGSGGLGGRFGGDGGKGDGVRGGRGGGGAGLGGALFLRAGSLALYQCRFIDNHAVPGAGDELEPQAEGKGGAVFTLDAGSAAQYLGQLRAQSYSLNMAPDQGEEAPVSDNNDYYIAQGSLLLLRRPPR